MRNDTDKALSLWAYDEATKTGTVPTQVWRRECQNIGYTRRRTGDWFLDTGSTPVRSTYQLCDEPTIRIMLYENMWLVSKIIA